jgi:hypothetical protein
MSIKKIKSLEKKNLKQGKKNEKKGCYEKQDNKRDCDRKGYQ